MPGVTVLPPPPTPFPKLPKMHNGSSHSRKDSVSDIKSAARDQVLAASKGASAASLLSIAKRSCLSAQTSENKGDIKDALSSLTKAVTLVSLFMDTPEFQQDAKKKGNLTLELQNFQRAEGRDLTTRMHSLESKLMEIDTTASRVADDEISHGSPLKTGGIADRVRQLQNAGLSVATSKRISRELPSTNTPPMSPDIVSPNPIRLQLPTAPSQPPGPSSLSSPPTAANSTNPSPHTLIPASSFGPPSPTSSASSSPRLNHFDFTGFQQAFPSIDELDEMDGLLLPSVPTGNSTGSRSSGKNSTSELAQLNHTTDQNSSFLPIHAPKAFPSLPLDPGPRPSSTPIPPTIDTFVSRPASPTAAVSGRSPMSPTVPRKPSGLGLNHQLSRSPLIPSGTLTPNSEKRELPFRTLFPKTLLECMQKPGFKILLLDVRMREEFTREHINIDTVVCIEPSVLLRERVTDETIKNSLSVAPKQESILFDNRDKFDLVAICDESSTIPDSPAIENLMKAIYELSFKTILRNRPMLLIGGLAAWKRDIGEVDLIRDGVPTASSIPTTTTIEMPYGSTVSTSPFHVGVGASPKLGSGLGINGSSSINNPSPAASSISILNGTASITSTSTATSSTPPTIMPIPVSAPVSRTAHARAPAESSSSSTSALFSPSIPESYMQRTSASARVGGNFGLGDVGVVPGSSPPLPQSVTYQQWIPPAGALASMDNLPLISPRSGDLRDNTPLSPPILDYSKRPLVRKPATSRPPSNSISSYTPETASATPSHRSSPSLASTGFSSIQYPQFPPTSITPITSPPPISHTTSSQTPRISPQVTGSSFSPSPRSNGFVSLPPQASINPSPLSRRRSDYVDQSQEALSGSGLGVNGINGIHANAMNGINGMVVGTSGTRGVGIDYPTLTSQQISRPPPVAVSSTTMERQDNRPRVLQSQVSQYHPPPAPSSPALPGAGPKPPTIQNDYPVKYWGESQIGTSGLRNLGNTCYMNSTIQCLSATVPFAMFFRDGRWQKAVNYVNPLGTRGNLAQAFANIVKEMWQGEITTISPITFRRSICTYASQFSGSEQHDSQEFLSFLLDGLHEDLNRVLNKPPPDDDPNREAELEKLPMQIASDKEWQIYRMRNNSLVVDFFQGQFRNMMECLTCHKTSTTYNSFMYLTLPIPTSRSPVTLQQCLDAFVREEVMEKSDAWNCPNCKVLRKATKRLSLSRLPPVLLIHLKRFSVKGHFTDKVETFVNFPLKALDLTNYMPPPLPPGIDRARAVRFDDPRSQSPPYRYDLYGVTNHFGTLSSGHYTAFIASRGGWLYCDDSRITTTDPKDVVGPPAYILFYKRTRT